MNKYLLKLFKEFQSAYGIIDTPDNFGRYSEPFANWITTKQIAASNYVQLYDYMKTDYEEQEDIIAEFGKGIYDTIAIEMANSTPYKPVVISPFAETITKESGIKAFKGKLTQYDGHVFVKYPELIDYYKNPNCHPSLNDRINTLMTQYHFSEEELKLILRFINSDKTLFIGTYGSLEDKDCKENLQRIRHLYQMLSDLSQNNVEFCSERINDSYLSAVKVNRVKTKEREKTLILKKHF